MLTPQLKLNKKANQITVRRKADVNTTLIRFLLIAKFCEVQIVDLALFLIAHPHTIYVICHHYWSRDANTNLICMTAARILKKRLIVMAPNSFTPKHENT